jgi:biopolymer transport protein ExbD
MNILTQTHNKTLGLLVATAAIVNIVPAESNDVLIVADELKARLEATVQETFQPEVHIDADKNTSYQTLAELMAYVQKAGITKFGFITESKNQR